MILFIVGMIIGFFIGGAFGLLLFALCSVGKMNDILMEEKGNEEDLEEVSID